MKVVDKVWVWRQRDALCLVSWARTNSFDDPYLIPVRFVKGQQTGKFGEETKTYTSEDRCLALSRSS